MKPSLVFPLVTACVGFGLGWLVKPAAAPATPKPPLAATPATKTTATPPPAAPAAPAPAEHVRPAAAGGPAAAAAERKEKIATAKTTAKLQRLAEAIGLSVAQQADLTKLITESQKVATSEPSGQVASAGDVLGQLAASAAALENGLTTLLSPEQAAAFDQLRKRERDNRIETSAQRELGDLTEVTDLSAEQRDEVLTQLRKASAGELAAVPAPLALVMDSSVLPLGPLAPSAQSIQTLRQLADGQAPDDPAALHSKLIESQRHQLDARLALLKDILTPAQLAQYQATVAEQYAIHDLMRPSHW